MLKTFGKIHTTLNSKLIKSLTSTTFRETLNSLLFSLTYENDENLELTFL